MNRLGHFIDHLLWEESKKLLDFQISQKAVNKHYNTINFFYFENVSKSSSATQVAKKKYFEEKPTFGSKKWSFLEFKRKDVRMYP